MQCTQIEETHTVRGKKVITLPETGRTTKSSPYDITFVFFIHKNHLLLKSCYAYVYTTYIFICTSFCLSICMYILRLVHRFTDIVLVFCKVSGLLDCVERTGTYVIVHILK